jgi:intracellular septation protein A
VCGRPSLRPSSLPPGGGGGAGGVAEAAAATAIVVTAVTIVNHISHQRKDIGIAASIGTPSVIVAGNITTVANGDVAMAVSHNVV